LLGELKVGLIRVLDARSCFKAPEDTIAGLVELVNNLVTVVAPNRECTGMPSPTLAPLSGYPW